MSISRHRFLIVPVVLGSALAWSTPFEVSNAAQPVTRKGGGAAILAEPLALRPGEPLSVRTLVQKPPAVTGTVSWTIETRRHRGYLATSALSPDGKKLATGGIDGIIRIWDAESGQFIRALVGHDSYVYGLAWSPDGHTLASAGSFDGTARLWDTTSGMTLRILKGHKGYPTHVAWSRDGRSLVVAGGSSGFITLWDVTKPESVKTSETGNTITGVAWDMEGKLVAVSGVTTGIQVWEVREAKTVHALSVPGQNGLAVAWSPDGKTLVGGGNTKTIVWDAETGKEKHVLDIPSAAIAFSPKGDSLAISSGTQVGVWTGGFDKEPKPLLMADARSLAWSPDGESLYGGATTAVKWRSMTGNAREIDVALDSTVQFSPGRPLITGINSAVPQLWDVTSGKRVGMLEGHAGSVTAAAWSRDGKLLATASTDKTVRLWDGTGKPVRTLKGHEGAVQCVAWADGKTLATGGADKTVRVWQSGSDVGKLLPPHKGSVTAVAWSRDGKHLASGDEEHTVHVSAPDVDKAPQSLTASAPVRSLAWSGTAKNPNLAVGGATGDVEIFAAVGGKLLQTFERSGSPPAVSSLAWAPDGITLLAGRGNHTAQVWQAGATSALYDLPGMCPIAHVEWSPGGNSMLLSETDRQVRVFDRVNGQLRSSVVADGKQVATVSTGGHFRVADEATCELVYVVQTAKGQETLTPKEFAARFRFQNKPTAVVLMDK